MKSLPLPILALAPFLLAPLPLRADPPTPIGGSISGVLTNGTYQILSNLVVDAGQSLTIEPGCTLLFDPGATFRLYGSLTATGQLGSQIRFTSSSVSPSPGDWQGLSFTGSSGNPAMLLDHVEIAYAVIGIQCEPGWALRASVSTSDIHHCSSRGVSFTTLYISIGSNSQILGNRIHDNGTAGIYLAASSSCWDQRANAALVASNHVTSNLGPGIALQASGGIDCIGNSPAYLLNTIMANLIAFNQVGIQLTSRKGAGILTALNNCLVSNTAAGVRLTGADMGISLINNTIVANGGAGVSHTNNAPPTLRNNIIAFNTSGVFASGPGLMTNAAIWSNDVFDNSGSNWMNYSTAFGTPVTFNATCVPADSQMNISIDPGFLDTNEFRLAPSSPLVNAGNPTNAPATDYEGDTRIGLPDIGYDESLAPAWPRFGSLSRSSDGVVRFDLCGQTNMEYVVYASTNLSFWQALSTNMLTSSPQELSDPSTLGIDQRYYRAEQR